MHTITIAFKEYLNGSVRDMDFHGELHFLQSGLVPIIGASITVPAECFKKLWKKGNDGCGDSGLQEMIEKYGLPSGTIHGDGKIAYLPPNNYILMKVSEVIIDIEFSKYYVIVE